MAVFLYGLWILSNGFKKLFSRKLKSVLEKITQNTFRALGIGAFVTSIIQSSSITIVTLIGLLNAGLLSLNQAIGVMLGAEIGTTITAQIVAFKIGIYYAPILFFGLVLLFFSKNKKLQYVGQVIFGFGLVFLGMHLMTQGAKPLKEMPALINALIQFGKNPFLGILAGTLFTALMQSSSATISLVIAISMEGLLTLPAAVALIFGANIGTCITGALASLKSGISSKRLSVAQLIINIFGVAIFGLLLGPFLKIVVLTSDEIPRQIANAHMLFNVISALVAIPFVGFLVRLTQQLIRGKIIEEEKGAKFLNDNILSTPGIAILQSHKEIIRMSYIAKDMLEKSKEVLLKNRPDLIDEVKEKENSTDQLHHIIDGYLTKISEFDLAKEESEKLTLLIHSVADIERVADHADNLVEFAEFRMKNKIEFSLQAQKELEEMFKKSIKSFSLAIEALEKENIEIARCALEVEKEVNKLDESLRNSHFERLKKGICLPESGPLYLEIIDNLERISDHAENIASGIIIGF